MAEPLRPRRRRRQRGASLVIVLAGLLAAAVSFTLMARLGRLCLERERADAAADCVAMAVATDYARALNVLSVTNKIWAVAEIAELLKKIPYIGWLFQVVPKPDNVQKIQDYLAGTGKSPGWGEARLSLALLAEVGCFALARENNLKAVPLWNGDDKASPSPIPCLNLRRRYGQDLAEGVKQRLKDLATGKNKEDGQQFTDPDWRQGLSSAKGDRYTYTRRDGQNVEVDPDKVRMETYTRKNGKRRTVYRYQSSDGKSRFVKKEASGKGKALDLVETGPHRVTLLGFRDLGGAAQGGFAGVGKLVVASRAETGGGSMEVMEFNGASYGIYLVPVNPSAKDMPLERFSVPQTGVAALDQVIQEKAAPILATLQGMIPTLPQVLH